MTNEFTDQHWEELRALYAHGGSTSVMGHINTVSDPARRRAYWSFAAKSFTHRDWNGKSFDALIEVVNRGVEESLHQMASAADDDTRDGAKEHANILMFNLSAELAECWPGDNRARERRHFETGLRLAEECIRIRRELGKPPERRALAYWVAGMHHLSLGNRWEALGTFETAAGLAAEQVAGTDRSGIKAGGDFAAILYEGYAGIARLVLGDASGRTRYTRAIEAFAGTAASFDGQIKDDARFGLEQLRVVEQKFVPAAAPEPPPLLQLPTPLDEARPAS